MGRVANLSRARQRGSWFSIAISTEIYTRKTYSTVNTITEKTLKISNSKA